MEVGYSEPCPRRVRAVLDGRQVVDTVSARYLWEHPYYPAWYLPEADVALDSVPSSAVRRDDRLPGHLCLDWSALEQWFEEDEEVFVHPRDPYTRVDVRDSSRHVVVMIDGTVVADSIRPRLLFETSLPVRYYLPKLDVRFELLTPTDTSSMCPYKGTANYWSVDIDGTIHRDIVWGYREPMPEIGKIAGLVCFYNERVDLIIDQPIDRPTTKFS